MERGENQCIPYIAPAAPQLFRIAAKREISNAMETHTQINISHKSRKTSSTIETTPFL